MNKMPFDIYICHNHGRHDRTIASVIKDRLEERGYRCLLDPCLPPGEAEGAAAKDLFGCRAMVLVFSEAANRSEQVHREVERARSREIPIVPFRIEDVTPRGPLEFLTYIAWIDGFNPPIERRLRQLVEAVTQLVGAAPTRSFTSAERAEARASIEPHRDVGPMAAERAAPERRRVDRRILAAILLLAIGAFLAGLAWTFRNVEDSTVSSLMSRPREARLVEPTRIATNLDIADVDVFFPGADLPETPVAMASSDACRRECAARTACGAFSYVGSDRLCYLKSVARSQIARPGTISGRMVRGPIETAR
jgi:hypothetical protein